MYLKELHLQNIKTFKDLTIDFTINEKPRLFTGFLGPNGVGKSIILDCIAVSLAGESAVRSALPSPRDWVRSGEEYGTIETTIDVSDEKESMCNKQLRLKYFVTGKEGYEHESQYMQAQGIHADHTYPDHKDFAKMTDYNSRGFLVCGYGPFRRSPREGEGKLESRKDMNPRSSRIISLFDEGSPSSDLASWLRNSEYISLKGGSDAKKYFKMQLNILNKTLPNVTFKEINKEGKVIFETPDGLVPLGELSDGYRSVIAWSADLVQHMVEAHSHLSDPMKGTGIALIDEIDAHLHPEAQRKIIDHMRDLFPNIQFILSSHSPFVAQSLKQNEIFLLHRDKDQNQIVVKPIETSFEGWRADQILTSDAFGLETSRDENTERELKEYEKLVIDIELEEATDKDKSKAKFLKEKLFSKIPFSGETQRIRELEKQIGFLQNALKKMEKDDPN